MNTSASEEVTTITSENKLFDLKLKEIWRFRDLLTLFIKREVVIVYKQTILGPFWFFIQPILTTIMFTIIFGNVAKISTDGIPHILFYLSGVTAWNYFAESLKLNAETFQKNSELFKKVYFPRVLMPIAVVISNLLKFFIQFSLFIIVLFYYLLDGTKINPNSYILLLPIYVFVTAALGLAFGLIISALTSKYRDLKFLVQFGVQLWMYATPIIYPLSSIPEKYQWIAIANPLTSVIEAFKYSFLGNGHFSEYGLLYSFFFTIIIFLFGVFIFNKTEKNFIDTV